jgi:hypothetical protein
MKRLLLFSLVFTFVLLGCQRRTGRYVFRVRAVERKSISVDNITEEAFTIQENAPELWSVVAGAQPGSVFSAYAQIGEQSIRLTGRLEEPSRGKFDVEYYYMFSKLKLRSPIEPPTIRRSSFEVGKERVVRRQETVNGKPQYVGSGLYWIPDFEERSH